MSALPVADVRVLEGGEAATLLVQPRPRLVAELGPEGDSAAGLARKLGLPRQRVNYHLRELEKAGLIEEVAERRKGNCLERIVRATAATYAISDAALGPLAGEPERMRDRFSAAYLVAAASRAIRELAVLLPWAKREGKGLATLTIEAEVRVASPAAQAAFAEDLARAVAEVAARHHDERSEAGRVFRVLACSWQAVTRQPPAPDAGGGTGNGTTDKPAAEGAAEEGAER